MNFPFSPQARLSGSDGVVKNKFPTKPSGGKAPTFLRRPAVGKRGCPLGRRAPVDSLQVFPRGVMPLRNPRPIVPIDRKPMAWEAGSRASSLRGFGPHLFFGDG